MKATSACALGTICPRARTCTAAAKTRQRRTSSLPVTPCETRSVEIIGTNSVAAIGCRPSSRSVVTPALFDFPIIPLPHVSKRIFFLIYRFVIKRLTTDRVKMTPIPCLSIIVNKRYYVLLLIFDANFSFSSILASELARS